MDEKTLELIKEVITRKIDPSFIVLFVLDYHLSDFIDFTALILKTIVTD